MATMTAAKAHAIVATAYNLHVGPRIGGDAMTPAKAAQMAKGDQLACCVLLAERGGSDLYTADDARDAYAFLA